MDQRAPREWKIRWTVRGPCRCKDCKACGGLRYEPPKQPIHSSEPDDDALYDGTFDDDNSFPDEVEDFGQDAWSSGDGN